MNHPTGNFSKKIEWIILALMIILLLGLINLPYIVGYLNEDGMKFSGAAFDRPDYAVHLSAIQSGLRGNWAYHPRFTSEQVPGVYIKLTYVILGNLCRLFNIPVDDSYQIARNVFFLVMCGVLYLTIALIFPQQITRLVAFWVVVCGSGFGWLQYIFSLIPNPNISPIDFWLMDGYILFGSMVFPHFSITTICLVGTFGLILYLQKKNGLWIWILLQTLFVISAFNQPYILILQEILLVVGVLYLNRDKKLIREYIPGFMMTLLIGVLGLLYNVYVLYFFPFWKIFTKQNITLSAPFVYNIFGYGGLWIVFLIGFGITLLDLRNRWHKMTTNDNHIKIKLDILLSMVWCVSALVLSYLPILSQRRFMHAYTFPLGILSVWGYTKLYKLSYTSKNPFFKKHFWLYITVFWVFISSFGTIYVSIGQSLTIYQKKMDYFDPTELYEAIVWLRNHAEINDVVLAFPKTCYLVLEQTGLRAYSGHFAETINYNEKQEWVKDIYSGKADWNEIRKKNINWVVVGPYEKNLDIQKEPNPEYFILRFNKSGIKIYQVVY